MTTKDDNTSTHNTKKKSKTDWKYEFIMTFFPIMIACFTIADIPMPRKITLISIFALVDIILLIRHINKRKK